MSKARENFITRLRAYRSAVGSDTLVEKDLTQKRYNQRAKMLRSGMSVVGFAMLEGFIDDRSTEILSRIGGSEVPFERLPEKMRRATTIGAVRAISSQLRYLDSQVDVVSYVQEQAKVIASTLGAGRYDLSTLALGASGSNMSHRDVTKILAAF